MSTPQPIIRAPLDLGPRVWGTETVVALGPGYLGKVLRQRAGAAGGLQYHQQKHETHHLVSGEAKVEYDDGTGALVSAILTAGQSVMIPPGTVHRVTAITDCVFFETSSPHFNDRVRVESDYDQPDTGGLRTTSVPLMIQDWDFLVGNQKG